MLTREEQKEVIIKLGGRALKFTNDGGKLYFRYYIPHPDKLTWKKLTDGLRLLYGIKQSDMYIRYKDSTGAPINVSDDGGLKIMFEDTQGSDFIRIEVFSNEPSTESGDTGMLHGSSIVGKPTMAMPDPGFPGVPPSRPGTANSMGSHGSSYHSNHPAPHPVGPGYGHNASYPPGPIPPASQSMLMTDGPTHRPPHSHGPANNDSRITLSPPNPQHALP